MDLTLFDLKFWLFTSSAVGAGVFVAFWTTIALMFFWDRFKP